ncbi:hypothetical protein TSAR_004816 [Trichomalopsis sarcophagae]|uniref:Uncharacterized protein n=1 Tax=Trichomalopsis sarcophagae TaxID=543379 RepID=A0A232EEG8_9HYME|nr:hypothetical protein TSAR_004816 [Trichomalopsis sarcophagae]
MFETVLETGIESDDDGYNSEIDEEVVEEVIEEYPCHGIPGSSVYIYAASDISGLCKSLPFAIGQEVRIGSWEACQEETWELPVAAEKCPIGHNHKDSQATLIRLVGQEIEGVGSFNLRLQFE